MDSIQGAFNYTADPECQRKTHTISFSSDNWQGKLLLGILENAIIEYLANNISEKLRKDAERFLFVDNEIFDVCLDILGHEKCTFRSKILEMHNKNLNFRKKFLHTRRTSI